ncbi:MAG: guanitoxin biosynthesis MBL fold metallo-hydrolase GntH [Proteobacteria bacterium]|nr:guanitoxin biosynthesis MBL fold metallo-hydrolase GntH [Pseudomonadota bacterium]
MNTTKRVLVVASVTFVAVILYQWGHIDGRAGKSSKVMGEPIAAESSPVKALTEQDIYYPGTEDLAPDEMRVVACGTGMPNSRPKQAAACFLVELGNGDKFIFDIGSGSAERISALKIPYDYLDKVFIGHLHSDHFGALADLWIGGVIGNRIKPLRVWGPSGTKPELGTKYALEHMEKVFTWDSASRLGNVDIRGQVLEVHEFDYKAVNQEIYNENGVSIRTIPAIHALDGPVSFILEWNGLKFAFSSDTFPNKWWMEHTKNADIAIHECFITPGDLIKKQKWTPETALNVGTQVHTSPAQFGKVMSEIKPRMAVGYHFFNDFDTLPNVLKAVRSTYDGPLALASDYMVFNITKDDIRVRMAVIDEDIWPQPAVGKKIPPDLSKRIGFSDYIVGGRVNYKEVVDKVYADINEKYGTDIPAPQ